MTLFKQFGGFKAYYLDLSKIYRKIRKYQSLHKHNITYLYDSYLSLNRFLHPATAKAVPELQSQASEKIALQHVEGLRW